MKALDYIESQRTIIDSNDYLTTLFRSGRSPLRIDCKIALTARISRINDDFGFIHQGCCLCTSEVISQLNLAGNLIENLIDKKDSKKLSICEEWLCDDKRSNNFWETIYKDENGKELIHAGYVFTAFALQAFMDINDDKSAKKAAQHLIDRAHEWYSKMDTISNRFHGLGNIINSLNRYLYPAKEKNMVDNFLRKDSYARIVINNYKNEEKYNLPEKMSLLPFLFIWRNKDNLGIDKDFVKKKAYKIVNSNYNDILWYKEGSWANDINETDMRIINWLYFWEYFLSDENAEDVNAKLNEFYSIVTDKT
ncbi:MAG TPA: hypothetical protein ENH01_07100 [Nitrospirae bacterium]|nr:hypothetical protein [Nitrospirota bacterium]